MSRFHEMLPKKKGNNNNNQQQQPKKKERNVGIFLLFSDVLISTSLLLLFVAVGKGSGVVASPSPFLFYPSAPLPLLVALAVPWIAYPVSTPSHICSSFFVFCLVCAVILPQLQARHRHSAPPCTADLPATQVRGAESEMTVPPFASCAGGSHRRCFE
jgi:hypothetical protein